MADSIDKKNPIDDLDLALNPQKPPLDILADNDIRREPEPSSGVHDLSEVLIKRPTDIALEPVVIADGVVDNLNPVSKPKASEGYHVPPRILSEMDALVGRKPDQEIKKVLRVVRHDLDYAGSVDEAVDVLDTALNSGYINEIEHRKLRAVLKGPEVVGDITTNSKSEGDNAVDQRPQEPKPEPVKKNEKPIENNGFVLPEELIRYIKSLFKHDIGPTLLLEAIEKPDLSKEEVLTTLSDGFHHLKILSEEEYKKSLSIMGETEEDIIKNTRPISGADPSSVARTRRSEVGAVEQDSKEVVPEPVTIPLTPDVSPVSMDDTVIGKLKQDLTDKDLESLVMGFYESGNFDEVIEYIKRIKNYNDRARVMATIVETLIEKDKDYDNARKVLEIAEDEVYKRDVLNFLNEKSKEDRLDLTSEDKLPEQILESELNQARNNYVKAQVEFKKKEAERGKLQKIKESLGFGQKKSSILSPIEDELEDFRKKIDEAKAEYIEAKRKRRSEIIRPSPTPEEIKNVDPENKLSPMEQDSLVCKLRFLEDAEKEWEILQKQTIEASSSQNEKIKKIKEITAKGLKAWSKVPLSVRLTIAPLIIGTGVGLGSGLVVGATYAGARAVRGIAGALGARGAGSLYENRAVKINEKARGEYTQAYASEEGSFEDRERKYMEARDLEMKRMKEQRVKKAMIMVGAGAVTGLLASVPESFLGDTVSSGSGAKLNHNEGISRPKTGVPKPFDGISRPRASAMAETEPKVSSGTSVESPKVPETLAPENSGTKILPPEPKLPKLEARPLEPTPSTPTVPSPETLTTRPQAVDILETKVELSSRGFLQDIHNLKAKIIGQYGGVDKIPPEIKTNIIDKPTVDIAKEYGLYKPGDVSGDSGMGYAGEKLSVDTNGRLVLEHTDGTKDFLSDAETGSIKQFGEFEGNKMFTPKPIIKEVPVDSSAVGSVPLGVPLPPEGAPTLPTLESNEIIPPENIIQIKPADKFNSQEFSPTHIQYKDSFVDIVNEGNEKVVKFGEQVIAHEHVRGTGKILVLDDKFQDGPKFSDIRGAFTEAFEKHASIDQVGKSPIAVPFEGGKIYIVQGLKSDPDAVKILLNGKEIANGVVGKGGIKIQYDPTLPKSGWLFTDNVFERAFNQAKKFTKTLSVVR